MRKLLFIIILISIAFYARGQTDFPDLAEKTSVSGAYEIALYSGGAGYRMSLSTLQAALFDSVVVFRDTADKYWVLLVAHADSIEWIADSSRSHTDRIASLEGNAVAEDSTWISIVVGTVNELDSMKFGDGDTYFYESSDDAVLLKTDGSTVWQWNPSDVYTYGNLVPQTTTKTLDLGTVAAMWRYVYTDRLYIDNTNTYIDVSGTDMALTSADAGTKTLAELGTGNGNVHVDGTPVNNYIAIWTNNDSIEGDINLTWNGSSFSAGTSAMGSGGFSMKNGSYLYTDTDLDTYIGSPGDNTLDFWVGGVLVMQMYDDTVHFTNSIPVNTVAKMLVDTTSGFVFGLGAGNAGDSASFQVGAYLGGDNEAQDSLIPRIWTLDLKGESGDTAVVTLYHDPVAYDDGSPTTIHSVGVGVDGGPVTVTSFDVSIFGPGYYWAEITYAPTGKKPKHLLAPLKCSRKRGP